MLEKVNMNGSTAKADLHFISLATSRKNREPLYPDEKLIVHSPFRDRMYHLLQKAVSL